MEAEYVKLFTVHRHIKWDLYFTLLLTKNFSVISLETNIIYYYYH